MPHLRTFNEMKVGHNIKEKDEPAYRRDHLHYAGFVSKLGVRNESHMNRQSILRLISEIPHIGR